MSGIHARGQVQLESRDVIARVSCGGGAVAVELQVVQVGCASAAVVRKPERAAKVRPDSLL